MYLSKIVLNYRNHTAQRDLGDVHKLHQRIMQAFPDETRDNPRMDWNILFRQEPDSEIILVQSSIEPNWSHLSESYVLERHKPRQFEPDENTFMTGRKFLFRLRANPSKRDKKTSKTVGLFLQSDQYDWFHRQSERNGFRINGIDIIPASDLLGRKSKKSKPIRIKTVLYQGVLEVSDSALFTQAIHQGIGRGKSYGCGLLSLSRASAL